MFFAVCDATWRVVVLLALAVAPYAAPVDAVASTHTATAAAHLVGFVAIAVALGLAVRASWATSKPLAWAVAATMVFAVVASLVFDGDRGPLARGTWLVAPLAWASIALFTREAFLPRARRLAVIAVAAVAMLSLAIGAARLGSRDALWKQAFAADPSNESAALAVADSLRGRGDLDSAYDTESGCVRARPDSCRCEEAADADAIDLGKYVYARASLERASSCPRTPRQVGMMAEALIGTNAIREGIRQAEIALSSNPTEPHAAYARAWGTMLKGYPADAKGFAEQAVALQRGLPAHLLLGLIEYQLADFDKAAVQFQAALNDDPNSVQANYDTALLAQRRNNYHDAREGYLKTIRLDPTFADAQYNLILLTFNAGVLAEAQHRFEEMATQCPTDRRLASLRAMLARASPPPKTL
jgi:tetratricopeptide (TPR) repeat protein